MGAKTTAEVEDAHTESSHIISYDPATERWSINGIDLSRNKALENEEGIVMLQGKGIVAHIYADDLAKIVHRSGYP
jgi:hypothetical protein